MPPQAPDPSEVLQNQAERAYMRQLLLRWIDTGLTPKQQEAVRLYYYGGRTLAQIAAAMHIAPSSVHRRLAAARQKLQKMAVAHAAAQRLRASFFSS